MEQAWDKVLQTENQKSIITNAPVLIAKIKDKKEASSCVMKIVKNNPYISKTMYEHQRDIIVAAQNKKIQAFHKSNEFINSCLYFTHKQIYSKSDNIAARLATGLVIL